MGVTAEGDGVLFWGDRMFRSQIVVMGCTPMNMLQNTDLLA